MSRLIARLRAAALDRPHVILLPLLAAAFYYPSVRLPFFWDDAANFNWMYRRSLASIWTDAAGFPYYRPLGFTVWRALQLAFGPTSLLPFHLANLAAHTANALLVAGLASRFVVPPAREARAPRLPGLTPLIAGGLMALFPFAALAVTHVAQGFHLFVTSLTLGAITCALAYRDSVRARWAVLSVVLAALAPFAHEEGVVTGALVLLAVLSFPRRLPASEAGAGGNRAAATAHHRGLILSAVAVASNGAFLVLWPLVPKTRPETFAWVGWESLGQSTVFFLEGLTFPVQFLARWLMVTFGWSDMTAVTALGVPALAVAVAALWVRRRDSATATGTPDGLCHPRRLAAFAGGCWLLASAPSMLALPFSYIIVSPRLQTFASPAAGLLWAGAIAVAANAISKPISLASRRRLLEPLAQAGLAVACLVAPAAHIARTVQLNVYSLRPIFGLLRAVRDHPGERQLLINAPNWIAPMRADYALGHEGVEIMPLYVSPQLLVWTNTGIRPPLDGVAFPNVFPLLKTLYFDAWGPADDWNRMAARLPDYDRVWMWRYTDDQSAVLEAGSVRLGAAVRPSSYIASFDERIWLVSAKVQTDAGWAHLDLTWHATAEATEDVFAHVFDCDGGLLGQWDGAALGGAYPLWLWPKGVTVRDVRHVPLAALTAEGCYRVEIGLFDPADGSRTAAYDPTGERLENDAAILKP